MTRIYTFMGSYSPMSREEAKQVVNSFDGDLVYSYGFEFKHPNTYRKPISKEEAMKIFERESFLDVDYLDDGTIKLNAYSEMDMY